MSNQRRVLLCIGCDVHDDPKLSLTGAEKDASDVFSVLTNPIYGNYPAATSILLRSPNISEVIHAIEQLMPGGEAIDTLTFYFAGHGGLSNGSYYLCFRETVIGRLSTTAWNLSRLFEIVNEKAPSQCNIIFDSCQSGGLVAGLGSLLKPELLGRANTSGISIFATSASDEYSTETDQGGLGTCQLLRVLRGEVSVQNNHPYLDLVEVGRAAADLIANDAQALGSSQTPVVWGLNLFGESRFSKNPHYNGGQPSSLYEATSIAPGSNAGHVIKESADLIWAMYYSEPALLTPKRVFDSLATVIKKLSDPEDITRFIKGISATLKERMLDSPNTYGNVQLLATFASLLLDSYKKSDLIGKTIFEFSDELISEQLVVLDRLQKEMCIDARLLASEGVSDFFYLALRISKILGYAATLLILMAEHKRDVSDAKVLVSKIIDQIVETYPEHLNIVSDEQTPYLMIYLHMALRFNMRASAETTLRHIICNLVKNKGRIARSGLPPDLAFAFVRARVNGDFKDRNNLLANPSEATAMVMLMSHLYNLAPDLDPYLRQLDHTPISIFLPNDHRDFARPIIQDGINHNFQIGHKVWKVSDLVARWNEVCEVQLAADGSLAFSAVRAASLCSALIFPNRSPWFLLAKLPP